MTKKNYFRALLRGVSPQLENCVVEYTGEDVQDGTVEIVRMNGYPVDGLYVNVSRLDHNVNDDVVDVVSNYGKFFYTLNRYDQTAVVILNSYENCTHVNVKSSIGRTLCDKMLWCDNHEMIARSCVENHSGDLENIVFTLRSL